MKKSFMPISILLLVCFLPINTFGGCIEGDCNDGYGTYVSRYGQRYVGEFKDGELHGQGAMTYPNGSKYIGEFKNGKNHGHGILTLPDGEKLVGEFRYGEFKGK